jgi:hypothetical protein
MTPLILQYSYMLNPFIFNADFFKAWIVQVRTEEGDFILISLWLFADRISLATPVIMTEVRCGFIQSL